MEPHMRVQQIGPEASHDEFVRLAELHISEINRGFISSLGQPTVYRMYRGIAASRHAFIFGVYDDSGIVGFICGAVSTSCVYRDVLCRQGFAMAVRLIPKAFAIRNVLRIVETLAYPFRHKPSLLPKAEIMNFCVRSTEQRKGIGRALFRRLVEEFEDRGVTHIRIVTGAQQVSAQGFYERLGALRHSEIVVHGDTKSIAYTYPIPKACQALPGSECLRNCS